MTGKKGCRRMEGDREGRIGSLYVEDKPLFTSGQRVKSTRYAKKLNNKTHTENTHKTHNVLKCH